jgi:hypothetical protein
VLPRITQRRWRILGAVILLTSLIMAVAGPHLEGLKESLFLFTFYWVGCVVLIAAALFIALLDLRYVRVQYRMAEREIFRRTLGEPAFREELRQATEGAEDDGRPEEPGRSD